MEVVMAMLEGLESNTTTVTYNVMMGLCGGARKKLGSLYWRLRAEIRRQLQLGRRPRNRKQRLISFHYDPFSYALNFDDGC